MNNKSQISEKIKVQRNRGKLILLAYDFFREGRYHEAIAAYTEAGKLYGSSNFEVNILLCERRLKVGKISSDKKSTDLDFYKKETLDVVKMENYQLKKEILNIKSTNSELQSSIDERFFELSVLTKLLDEMTNANQTTEV